MAEYNEFKNKPGRKHGSTALERVMPKLRDDEILEAKVEILRLISSGEANTLAGAARLAGLNPLRVHAWSNSDPDFQQMAYLAREVRADKLEEKLETCGNFIAWMFLLKAQRPQYRDNYRRPQEDSKAQELLGKLLELAKSSPPVKAEK